MQSISISEPQVVGVSTPPNYYCPVCRLSTYKPVDNNELEFMVRFKDMLGDGMPVHVV